jgi:hypothetical protein
LANANFSGDKKGTNGILNKNNGCDKKFYLGDFTLRGFWL